MNTLLWLVLGLALFDGMLLVLLYFTIRRMPLPNSQALWATGAGLGGFVAHALIFFSGGFLVVQLATIAGAFWICLGVRRKPMQK